MKEYVWLFPIIFMIHDMEEIIGFKFFLRQNETELQKRFPAILRRYKDFSTEGFALAVYEELILCIAISALAYFINREFLWYIWLGAFLALGAILVFINIFVAQKLMGWFTKNHLISFDWTQESGLHNYFFLPDFFAAFAASIHVTSISLRIRFVRAESSGLSKRY